MMPSAHDAPAPHDPHHLNVERLGSGITLGECSCGAWEMRVGPDATDVREETEEELLKRNFRQHAREPRGKSSRQAQAS